MVAAFPRRIRRKTIQRDVVDLTLMESSDEEEEEEMNWMGMEIRMGMGR